MFSSIFINRPILASVLSIIIVMAGLVSIVVLPIAQYPDIVPPQVSVQAVYPGASAEVIAQTVAAPLEQQINGVDNMLYIDSASSSNGSMSMTVYFKVGTNPDQATINVNNRVQQALATLPSDVRAQGVTVLKRSSTILQIVTLFSPDKRFDSIYMSNFALVNILDDLKRIPGVGDAQIFGAKDYSMRIWLQPDKLAQLKLSPMDISTAIREQNSQFAAGKIGAEPLLNPVDFTYTITTLGRLTEPEQFEKIIIRSNPDGSQLLLKDVARVELNALDFDFNSTINGMASVAVGVYLQPGANALSVTEAVQKSMKELKGRFPAGLEYKIPYDTTRFIQVSIEEVIHTLVEAMILVFLVVFLFLQNWRATLIPCLAVPVSIIGTFAGMYALDFSINTLTLFGLVLAIGIVVDDAIVVLENVERIMSTEHLSPKDATIKAMQEVTGPVVAIVLVLCSVFIPVGFLGGLAGQMYKQFAITIAVSVVISGIVALTLTPALCALILKDEHSEKNRFFRWFNRQFEHITSGYAKGVQFLLKRIFIGLTLFTLMGIAAFFLFKEVPSALVPDEDQGYIISAIMMPDGTSLSRTTEVTNQVTQMALKNPAIENIIMLTGLDLFSFSTKTSSAVAFIILKNWKERKKTEMSSQSIVKYMFGQGAQIPQGLVIAFNPPPISGMSTTGGFEFYLQNRGSGDPKEIANMVQKLIGELSKRSELTGISSSFSANVPQIYIKLDREKAKAYGVNVSDIFTTMQSTLGSYYVNDFNKLGRTFKVQMQAEANFRARPEDIRNIYVRSMAGEMIPLTSLVEIKQDTGPDIQERFNLFPAAKIIGGPVAGVSSGQALQIVEEVASKSLPADYTIAWSGASYQEKLTGGTSAQAFIFGLILVFLILAAQYEKWSLPVAVISAVPFALFGALLANYLRGLANDIYFQVALVTLIGLAAKNAILIVEFAVLKFEQGNSLIDSAIQAAKLRFRPIVMTSMAFVLGCLPLAISSGAGAASRHSIGTGVIGGMLAATFIAIFFVPLFYRIMMTRTARKKSKGDEKK